MAWSILFLFFTKHTDRVRCLMLCCYGSTFKIAKDEYKETEFEYYTLCYRFQHDKD